ncbi:MAG: DUF6600 domain-containing protein [Gammaproteobacteria bacterium]
MNTRFSFRVLFKTFVLAVLFLLLPPPPAHADHAPNEAVGLFYGALAPYGTWIDHMIYGWVWYPHNVPRDWQPYTAGYWTYTQPYGWLWTSDWSWGWAPFHYGRWVWDPWYGWIWVPGSIWAPAWVFWSYGGGYASWAPMPPYHAWSPFISTMNYYGIVPWYCWVIVHERDFPHHRHHHRHKFIDRRRNREILKNSHFFNHLRMVDDHLFNQGVPFTRIEKATGKSLKPVSPRIFSDAKGLERGTRGDRRGDGAVIYRPVDVRPTPDILRREVQSARQYARRIMLSPSALPDRDVYSGQVFEPPLPGRLSGKPMPPEYRNRGNEPAFLPEIQAPETPFLTLPQTREELGAGPRRDRGAPRREDARRDTVQVLPHDDASVSRQRGWVRNQEDSQRRAVRPQQDMAGPQLLDLERQQQAEQRRLEQDVLRQRKQISPPSERPIKILPWDESEPQWIEQPSGRGRIGRLPEQPGEPERGITPRREQQPAKGRIGPQSEQPGERERREIPWHDEGQRFIEQPPEQGRPYRQPERLEQRQRKITPGQQFIQKPAPQGRPDRHSEQQAPRRIEIPSQFRSNPPGGQPQPGSRQNYRQPGRQGQRRMDIHSPQRGGQPAIGQQPQSGRGERGRSMRGVDSGGRSR